MKKSYRNIIILAAAICFLAVDFLGDKAEAKINSSPEELPTPITKATPKSAKTSATPSNQTPPKQANNQKADANSQIIVTATSVRIRQQPTTNSSQLSVAKLGKTFPVSSTTASWYEVRYADGKSGWILKTFAKDYDSTNRESLYREIADKYQRSKITDFATASEVADFLKLAQPMSRTDETKAALGFRRLRVLAAALKAIPFGKGEQSPYKSFLKDNQRDVVYSEPSGEWYVRSDSFWDLQKRYSATLVADDIAWEAAQNPIAGECEGYVNCYLDRISATDGEYLSRYPNGRHGKQALINIASYLEPLVADLKEKSVYTPPSDISDRAEFNRFLTELRATISKVSFVEKNKPLQQINKIGEGYK